MANPTVKEMVAAQLKAGGFDGIDSGGGCSCELGNLMPCSVANEPCTAGYKARCVREPDCHSCADHGWHIQAEKPRTTTADLPLVPENKPAPVIDTSARDFRRALLFALLDKLSGYTTKDIELFVASVNTIADEQLRREREGK